MKTLILAALLLAAPVLSACNTVEGFGQDLQKAGNHVEDRADQVKRGN